MFQSSFQKAKVWDQFRILRKRHLLSFMSFPPGQQAHVLSAQSLFIVFNQKRHMPHTVLCVQSPCFLGKHFFWLLAALHEISGWLSVGMSLTMEFVVFCSRNLRKKSSNQVRAKPKDLQQEDCDAVWNELAHFKLQNKNLMWEK